jgi:tetratricopeptide (TPR) repeat protein
MSAPHDLRPRPHAELEGEPADPDAGAATELAAAAFHAVVRTARGLDPDVLSAGSGVRYELLSEALARGDDSAVQSAARTFQAVFTAREGILGPEHPDTVDARHDVARVDLQRGELDAAEAGFGAVLELRERISGSEHPETLAAWHNLAAVHLRRERWDEAEAGFRAVLAARERVHGPEHPHTLIVRHELAVLALKRGRRAEADHEFRELLAVCRKLWEAPQQA